MKKLLVLAALALGACSSAQIDPPATRMQFADSTLPPVKSFQATRPTRRATSNADIARDFLDLHFQLESGRELPAMTRFEMPVTVRLTGQANPMISSDLRGLITRLRNEAGIDIRQVPRAQSANITIEAVSREDIKRTLPHAACFVVPNVSSLAEFRRMRRSPKTSWSNLTERTKMGIFIPADASPQEARDCLHEELAQSLGPLNDLYRLSNSVFNDDNVHTVLTDFDMLILRATYAPELRSGMTRAQVSAVLPGVLNRMNPAGRGVPSRAIAETPRSWILDVETALGRGSSEVSRQRAAGNALRTASTSGWQDHRRAFSHYMVGRSQQAKDPQTARTHFETAKALLGRSPDTELHRAYISTQTAAYDIARGDGRAALAELTASINTASRYQNAALLATLMLLQAEAYDQIGRPEEARRVRLDSLGWARYGFGPDWAVRAKMEEIAALNPL
ncbi:MAG: DUF2927 domain-containing protein [Paracoccaceae bacterium]